MFKLKGKVQHYAWGGKDFIPALLSVSNKDDRPYAEYWMGVHPSAPASIELNGESIDLPSLIQTSIEKYLGPEVLKNFNDLPFLLKILDVKEMLSIQVHPSKEEAVKGFERENQLGIDINSPNRNYKDANHKPEMMLALSEFWLLHGFQTQEKLERTLSLVPEFTELGAIFKQKGYRELYQHVMEMDQEEVDAFISPLAARILPAYEKQELPKSSPDFWAARAMKTYPGKFDRGIFSIYFFNLVNLKKGEAIFQGAGLPHAYLEGQNVELMSNSDNVLRGGLTPKYVDVDELMKHTLFEPIIPQKMEPVVYGPEKRYNCPVPDFGMSLVTLQENEECSFQAITPEIVFVLAGNGLLSKEMASKGNAFFVEPLEHVTAVGPISFVRSFVP